MLNTYLKLFTQKKFTLEETKSIGKLYFAIGIVLGALGIIIGIPTQNNLIALFLILLSYPHVIIGALFLARA